MTLRTLNLGKVSSPEALAELIQATAEFLEIPVWQVADHEVLEYLELTGEKPDVCGWVKYLDDDYNPGEQFA